MAYQPNADYQCCDRDKIAAGYSIAPFLLAPTASSQDDNGQAGRDVLEDAYHNACGNKVLEAASKAQQEREHCSDGHGPIGVWYLGWILETVRGKNLSDANAYRLRGLVSAMPALTPPMESSAPMPIIMPPAAPIKCWAASANGFSDAASPGKAPIATV